MAIGTTETQHQVIETDPAMTFDALGLSN